MQEESEKGGLLGQCRTWLAIIKVHCQKNSFCFISVTLSMFLTLFSWFPFYLNRRRRDEDMETGLNLAYLFLLSLFSITGK